MNRPGTTTAIAALIAGAMVFTHADAQSSGGQFTINRIPAFSMAERKTLANSAV